VSPAGGQDSKFPKDTGINPRLADIKEQTKTRNYRMTLTLPAHSLAVSRFNADYFSAFCVHILSFTVHGARFTFCHWF